MLAIGAKGTRQLRRFLKRRCIGLKCLSAPSLSIAAGFLNPIFAHIYEEISLANASVVRLGMMLMGLAGIRISVEQSGMLS